MSKKDLLTFTNEIMTPIKQKEDVDIQFLHGNYIDSLKRVIFEVAPYGKVAFIATNQSYISSAKQIFSAISDAGSLPIGITLNGGKLVQIEELASLFALPDDVRVVVSLDTSLARLVGYFAHLKNIVHIVILSSPCMDNVLSNTVYIKSGGKLDRVRYHTQKIVLIDDDNINNGFGYKNAYLSIVSKLIALYDYRLYVAINGIKANKYAFGLIKQAFSEAISWAQGNSKIDGCKLFLCGLKAEVGNMLTDGLIAENSSLYAYNVAREITGCDSDNISISEIGAVLALYANKLDTINELSVGRYIDGINRFCYVSAIDRGSVLNRLLKQIKCYKTRLNALNAVILNVTGQAKRGIAIMQMVEDYIKSEFDDKIQRPMDSAVKKEAPKSTRSETEIEKCITLAQYFPFGYNGLTAMRDKG